MKNLEKFGVQELDAAEVVGIDGGLFGIITGVAAVLGLTVAYAEAIDTFYDAGYLIGTELANAYCE